MRSYPRGWPYCRLINSASDSVSTHIHTVMRNRSTVPAFSHTMMGAPPKGFGIEWRHMGVSPNDLSVSPAYRRPNNRCASSAFVHTMMVQNPAFRPCASPRGLMMGASKGPGIPPAVSGIPSQFFSGPGSFMRP